MKVFIIGLALLLGVIYTAPLLACDCDTAAAITGGMQDRLHQPWPNNPERLKENPKNPENGPKQEVQPANQPPPSKGEVQKQGQPR